jgi:hypothetical protein
MVAAAEVTPSFARLQRPKRANFTCRLPPAESASSTGAAPSSDACRWRGSPPPSTLVHGRSSAYFDASRKNESASPLSNPEPPT